MRKSIGILALLLFSTSCLLAQVYPRYAAYTSTGDKNFTFYQRKTKQELERQHYRRATLHALNALSVTDKKKQIGRAQEWLNSSYSTAIQSSERSILQLQQQAAISDIDEDKKVALLYEVTRIYRELNQLILGYQQLSNDKKVGDWRSEFYKAEIKQAQADLKTAQTTAAAFHYQNAMALPANEHWEIRLAKARALKIAYSHDANYRDVKTLYAAAQNAGQVQLQIQPIENRSRQYSLGQQDLMADQEVSSALREKKFSFVRVASNNDLPDVSIQLIIDNLTFSKPTTTKTVDKESKIIDKKKEDVARATVTTFQRNIEANATYHFLVTDIASGDALRSETGTLNNITVHTDSWYQVSGDKRAVGKSVLNNNRAEPLPSNAEMFRETLISLRGRLADHVVDFSQAIGH